MARTGFTDTDYLKHPVMVLPSYRPMSYSVWVKSPNSGDAFGYTNWLWENLESGSTSPGLAIRSNGTVMRLYSGGSVADSSSFTASTGWTQYGWTWATDDSVAFYRNGALVSTGSLALNSSPDTGTVSRIGSLGTLNIDANCAMAEQGIWNAILTASEWAALGVAKRCPLLVRRGSLQSYAPLRSRDIDVRRTALTLSGSLSYAEHPPGIVYPTPAQVRRFGTGAAPPTTGTITSMLQLMGVG